MAYKAAHKKGVQLSLHDESLERSVSMKDVPYFQDNTLVALQ